MKTELTVESQIGEVQAEAEVSNYKDFDGILMPAKMIQKAAGQEIAITIEKVTVNEKIPAEKFDMPADVKALTDKAGPK